jgi:hypothetical protein
LSFSRYLISAGPQNIEEKHRMQPPQAFSPASLLLVAVPGIAIDRDFG